MNFIKKIFDFFYPDNPSSKKDSLNGNFKVHDFRNTGWGWNISYVKQKTPQIFDIMGHGYGIRKGDRLILQTRASGKEGKQFLVSKIKYFKDPRDMFEAEIKF